MIGGRMTNWSSHATKILLWLFLLLVSNTEPLDTKVQHATPQTADTLLSDVYIMLNGFL